MSNVIVKENETLDSALRRFKRSCAKAGIQQEIRKPGGVVDGKEIKMEVKAGDKVIYSKYAGTEVKLEDEKFIIVKQNDILAVIE